MNALEDVDPFGVAANGDNDGVYDELEDLMMRYQEAGDTERQGGKGRWAAEAIQATIGLRWLHWRTPIQKTMQHVNTCKPRAG